MVIVNFSTCHDDGRGTGIAQGLGSGLAGSEKPEACRARVSRKGRVASVQVGEYSEDGIVVPGL